MLATESGGRNEFELDVATVGDALRARPAAALVMDARGVGRPLVHVYLDGERMEELDAPVGPSSKIRIVAAVAGG